MNALFSSAIHRCVTFVSLTLSTSPVAGVNSPQRPNSLRSQTFSYNSGTWKLSLPFPLSLSHTQTASVIFSIKDVILQLQHYFTPPRDPKYLHTIPSLFNIIVPGNQQHRKHEVTFFRRPLEANCPYQRQ
jgi:hypothetical protein